MTRSKTDGSVELWNPAIGQRFTVTDDMCPLVEIFCLVSSKVSATTSHMLTTRYYSIFIHLTFFQ